MIHSPKVRSGDKESRKDEAYVKDLVSHQEDLRAFIYALLPNSPAADDVLQNTNLILWRKKKAFKQGTNFHAWAFKIARIQVQHQYDRAKRETRLVFSESTLNNIADAASDNPSRERELKSLENCIGKLNDKQRNIINARYSPGDSLEMHGKKTRATPGSLRISLFRIRAILRRCVEETLAGEPS
jgi:RNA polymerase sigma-70 factor (ECF subfamily)